MFDLYWIPQFFLVFLKSPSAANQAINMKYSDALLKRTRRQRRQCGFLSQPADSWWRYLNRFLDDGLQRLLFQEKIKVKANHLILVLFRILKYSPALKHEFVVHHFFFIDFSGLQQKVFPPYPRKHCTFIPTKGFQWTTMTTQELTNIFGGHDHGW